MGEADKKVKATVWDNTRKAPFDFNKDASQNTLVDEYQESKLDDAASNELAKIRAAYAKQKGK